jgi:hypothetical protein
MDRSAFRRESDRLAHQHRAPAETESFVARRSESTARNAHPDEPRQSAQARCRL